MSRKLRVVLQYGDKLDPITKAEFEQLLAALQTWNLGDTLPVLTRDPASPANDTAWLLRDSSSPENLSLRVRRRGLTHDVPLFTFPLP